MDSLFEKASISLGGSVAPDHLKLVFSILSTYVCAIVFKRIGSATVRHVFSILYTPFIMLGVLKLYDGFIHITGIAILSFLFMKYNRNSPWTNFTMVMSSMALCHIGRLVKGFEGDTNLDYSGALMIITIKLSSFGFNISDGQYKKALASDHNESMKITHYPTWIEYFGWVYFFGGFLAGPTCEYMDYSRFVDDKTPRHALRPALREVAKSLFFIAALVYLAPTFNYFEALKPEWSATSFTYKMVFIQLSAFLTRCKYYSIWALAEGASILAGFGYNGVDDQGREKWDLLRNVHAFKCEGAQSFKELSENWNIGANHWLRHYVYLRLVDKEGKASTATLKTYVISSMWHGFQPGFYIFFMTASVLQLLARQVRRSIRPFTFTKDGAKPVMKPLYDIATWVASMGTLNMLVPCFDLLHIGKIMHVWRQVYYCHFIAIAVFSLLFYTLIKPNCRHHTSGDKKKN